MLTMEEVSLAHQRVLIREDFNVPMKEGKISHFARIDAALPTIKKAVASKAKVILMSHLGRPKEGEFDATYSLKPVAEYLESCLGQKIRLFQLKEGLPDLQDGDVVLLENVRFLKGEEQNDLHLAKQLASLCQIFVMDAFAVAHREQASTCGVAQFAPLACAGPLLQKELNALQQVFSHPQKPVVAIVGGSKVSTKLKVLTHLLDKVDVLVVGGGIANTFLAAKGCEIGGSLFEQDLIPIAKNLLEKAEKLGKTIWLPQDVIVAENISDPHGIAKDMNDIQKNEKIFDIGPKSQQSLEVCIKQAKTLLWNGPVGVFESAPFAKGTEILAHAIASSSGYSVAGGGDTLSAIEQFEVGDRISYLSTGGGAFLEMLEGKTLPGVGVLESRSKEEGANQHSVIS